MLKLQFLALLTFASDRRPLSAKVTARVKLRLLDLIGAPANVADRTSAFEWPPSSTASLSSGTSKLRFISSTADESNSDVEVYPRLSIRELTGSRCGKVVSTTSYSAHSCRPVFTVVH